MASVLPDARGGSDQRRDLAWVQFVYRVRDWVTDLPGRCGGAGGEFESERGWSLAVEQQELGAGFVPCLPLFACARIFAAFRVSPRLSASCSDGEKERSAS